MARAKKHKLKCVDCDVVFTITHPAAFYVEVCPFCGESDILEHDDSEQDEDEE
jgi:rRNA maturation endonuclease Nob1